MASEVKTSPLRLALVFAALFAAYQLPYAVGVPALILVYLSAAWLCGRALGFRGLDAWYMGLTPGWWRLLAAAFALAVLAKAAALGVGSGLGVYTIAPTSDAWGRPTLLAAIGLLPYTFFPSIAEDILTRGFLMRALPGLSRRWLFIVASAALFVLNHIYRLANGPLEWLMLFSFGLAYAAALFYSRSLWPAIGLHWGWNFAGQFADRVAAVDAPVPAQGQWVSIGAHLVLLAVMMLAARMRVPTPRTVLQN